jgi:hypothetical protein
MSNYKYENKKHQLTGAPCIYPAFYVEHSSRFPETNSLPTDPDGYCIFHGKNKTWKVENVFNEKFIELMKGV